MERATDPNPPEWGQRRSRGSTRSRLSIDEEQIIRAEDVPHGSRFRGYTGFVVQDLLIRPHVVDFRCERWQAAHGRVVTAPLPPGIRGHFGPHLRRFVLALYHQGQMTVPRVTALLRTLAIVILRRQR